LNREEHLSALPMQPHVDPSAGFSINLLDYEEPRGPSLGGDQLTDIDEDANTPPSGVGLPYAPLRGRAPRLIQTLEKIFTAQIAIET
jgi:hypothetical protein